MKKVLKLITVCILCVSLVYIIIKVIMMVVGPTKCPTY